MATINVSDPLQCQHLAGLAVTLTKVEVIRDIERGYFLASDITCFSDLHNYVDANCYGGLCDEAVSALWADDEVSNERWLAWGNGVQEEVDRWLRDGEHHVFDPAGCDALCIHTCEVCDREGCSCHVTKTWYEPGEESVFICVAGQGCQKDAA